MTGTFSWPPGFERIPSSDWVERPLQELALKYDSVEQHGWYANLDRSVDQIAAFLSDRMLLMDYSGGTGILDARLLERIGDRPVGILIIDSSPKFLRLAVEKLGHDERVAFRLIRYRKDERRLERIDEVLPDTILERGVDAISSTNAIHLYHDLAGTLASWERLLGTGGRVFAQSGNIDHPDCGPEEWIIDRTVEDIQRVALDMVAGDDRWAAYRGVLSDPDRMARHDALRRKYFLPVRPLSFYVEAFECVGLRVVDVSRRTIEARVDQWYDFLSAYHEGVLGWVGGTAGIEGTAPDAPAISDRLELIRRALESIFEGRETFGASWTYLVCQKGGP